MRRVIITDQAPTFRGYPLSQGVATESLVFLSTMAFDDETHTRMAAADTIEQETRICLDALAKVLAEEGASLADVVKTTVYLSDRSHYQEMNDVYRQYWAEGEYPTRCTLYVGIGSDCRVEIDAIAVRPSAPRATTGDA